MSIDQPISAGARVRSALRADSYSPWLPVALAAAIVALVFVADLIAPQGVRNASALSVACVLFVVAYLPWPKPTLLVFALFVLLYHTLGRWLTPDLRHIDEIVVPVLFVLALLRTKPWRRGLIEPLRDGALLVMFVAGIGSSLVNDVPNSVWSLGLLLLVKVFAFLYIVLWHDFDGRDVRQQYPLVLGLGIVTLALVPFEVLDPQRFHQVLNLQDYVVAREGLPNVTSIFFRPILFAWFCGFVGLFLIAGYVHLRRWWLLLLAALFSVGTVLAGRRRSIAGVAVGLIGGIAAHFAAVRSWRESVRAWWPAVGGAIVLAIAFAPSLIGLAGLTVNPVPGQGVSPDARVALYQTSVLIARDDFPFGAGLGRYGSGTSRAPYSPVYFTYGLDKIDGLSPEHSSFVSDTFWPRILGETGFVGLAALIVFTVVLTVQVWRAAMTKTDDLLVGAFVLGAWMVFIQALVETLASSMFDSPPRIYLLFGAVGMALALARQRAPDSRQGAPGPRQGAPGSR